MKIVSIKGKELIVDFDEKERDIFLRNGLQIWIDAHIGSKKVKVLEPFEPDLNPKKSKLHYEMPEEFQNECIEISLNSALKSYIDKFKSEKLINKKAKNESKRSNKKA